MGHEQAILLEREPRVTVEQFLALASADAFEEVGRVELIDGQIVVAGPTSLKHGRALAELASAVCLVLRDGRWPVEALLRVSAELAEDSLPDVDLVIAARAEADFVTAATARLFVEVADGTLDRDIGCKQRLYARACIPEYWVVDVDGRRIIRLHEPEGQTYRQRAEFAFGQPVPSAAIEGLTVDTSRLA